MGDFLGPALSIGAGLFGGDDDSAPSPASQSSSQVSGYYALPQFLQNPYQLFGQNLTNLYNNKPMAATAQANAPASPYDSQALYQLQQQTPGRGVQSVGQVEPFNEYQKNALNAFGQPDYSQAAMQQYMNPYTNMVQNSVLQNIQRQSDIARSKIKDQAAQYGGKFATPNSAYGTQLNQNDESTQRVMADALANLGYQGYNSALGLRQQSLQDMLNAGNLIQTQNQNLVNASQPNNLYKTSDAASLMSAYAPYFGAYPTSSQGSSTQTGGSAGYSTPLQQLGGLAGNYYSQPGANGAPSAMNNFFGTIGNGFNSLFG